MGFGQTVDLKISEIMKGKEKKILGLKNCVFQVTLKNYGVWTYCVFKIKQKNCGFGIKQKNDKIWINCGFDNQEGMSRKIIGLRQNGRNCIMVKLYIIR